MNCIYQCNDVYIANEGKMYMERMNANCDIIPFFDDYTVYVTLCDDTNYAITNSQNEVFCIGNDGVQGIDKFLARVRQNAVILNGVDYCEYLAKQKKKAEELENERAEKER